jgi:hypothetical protein
MLNLVSRSVSWLGLSGVTAIWITLFWSLAVFSWLETVWDQPGNAIGSFQAISISWGRYVGMWVESFPWLLLTGLAILMAITAACLQNVFLREHNVA